MNDLDQDLVIHQIIALMDSYSFDTNRQNLQQLVQKWLQNYDVDWIHLATIEALYLGRYKAISIEQLLHSWSRIGKPNIHFGKDFERLVSRKLPKHFSEPNNINSEQPKSDRISADSSQTINTSGHPVASIEVTPLPDVKITAPPTPKLGASSNEYSTHRTLPSSKKIVSFQPVPDGSDFFQKLKALTDNQQDEEPQS